LDDGVKRSQLWAKYVKQKCRAIGNLLGEFQGEPSTPSELDGNTLGKVKNQKNPTPFET